MENGASKGPTACTVGYQQMEGVHISKELMSIDRTTWRHTLEESNIFIPTSSNLTYHKAVHCKVVKVSTIFSDVRWWNVFHVPCSHEHVGIPDKIFSLGSPRQYEFLDVDSTEPFNTYTLRSQQLTFQKPVPQ